MSLNMLVETREGCDYTGRDCRGWMADVGFRDSYVEPLHPTYHKQPRDYSDNTS